MGGMSSLATVGLDLALGHEAKKRKDKEIKRARDREIALIGERDAGFAADQAKDLKRRQAAARARAGASGLSTSGGSIDAVLRGLEAEAEDNLAERRRQSESRIGELREGARQKKRRNLLEQSSRWIDAGTGLAGRSLLP